MKLQIKHIKMHVFFLHLFILLLFFLIDRYTISSWLYVSGLSNLFIYKILFKIISASE